jgi:hypothetical protein
MSKDSKFIVKGKRSAKKENSAFLASRGTPEKGKKSFTGGEPSAFLAKRGEPEKGSVTFKDSRYK